MQKSRYAPNIQVDGDPYLEGYLGLSLFPSQKAKANAARYETWVNQSLTMLWSKFTGSRVMMAISSKRGTVTIRPRDPSPDPTQMFDHLKSASDLMCQARTLPLSEKDATIKGTPWTEGGRDYPTTTATGRGSDALVLFNPWLYNNVSCGSTVPDNRADYVLVHELVHGLSSISGRFATLRSAPRIFDNLEEFTAVVVTNVYISETGGRSLVGGHSGEVLPARLMPSEAFYNEYKEPLQSVCTNEPALVRQLQAGKNIPHNPFLYCNL